MIIQRLIDRVEEHFEIILQEELNVDKKRVDLVSQKGFDALQIFETVKINSLPYIDDQSLKAFFNHYQIEFDDQFIHSFLYRYSGKVGFTLEYKDFMDFILPCEDDDARCIAKNKNIGGARTILHYKMVSSLRELFYAELHYHHNVERSKKALFRDFEFKLLQHPLCQFKNVTKDQISSPQVWRRICYMKSKSDTKFLRDILIPEDYMQHTKIQKQFQKGEDTNSQLNEQKRYLKNNRKSNFIECPPSKCLFYENTSNDKFYNSDKFIIEARKYL